MSSSNFTPFHLVEKSPWPILVSYYAFSLVMSLVMMFYVYQPKFMLWMVSALFISLSASRWWLDMDREATFQGDHLLTVVQGLRYGMLLFIGSEVMFFSSFFWSFFHSSLNPTIVLGFTWPPQGIETFHHLHIPLFNTILLLSSGVTVTWAHKAIYTRSDQEVIQAMLSTIFLGFLFTTMQAIEYYQASFTFTDSVYGSTFFMATGFHGIHVIIGSLFLTVMLLRWLNFRFNQIHYFSLEASIWYWHFVDVVWLFLYLTVYWWGN